MKTFAKILKGDLTLPEATFSSTCRDLIRQLARSKSREAPPALRRAALQAWTMWAQRGQISDHLFSVHAK